MKVEYDKAHDVAYFRLSPGRTTRQVRLDPARVVDYGADGSVIGVEFISPSHGIDVAGVPRADEVEREARRIGLSVRIASS